MKKKYLYYILAVICFLITISAAVYPFLSNYLADRQHQKKISIYQEHQEGLLEEQDSDTVWEQVEAYNRKLNQGDLRFIRGEAQDETYKELLNIDGYGMMGYLEISKIDVRLPIYHGTGEAELTAGVGHLEGTSLPAGGEGNHTVLTSHSGYPGAKLFTDLTKLEEGDIFTIYVLDRTLTYQVEQIKMVVPSDSSFLTFEEGKDYVTLMTCTPYGINSHRLLVRGIRVMDDEMIVGIQEPILQSVWKYSILASKRYMWILDDLVYGK